MAYTYITQKFHMNVNLKTNQCIDALTPNVNVLQAISIIYKHTHPAF